MRDVGVLAFKAEVSIFSTCQVNSRKAEFGILLNKGTLQLRYYRPQIRRLLLIMNLLGRKLASQLSILLL